MDMEQKLNDVYGALDRQARIVELSAGFGILGPLNQGGKEDKPRYGFTDGIIAQIRLGVGGAREEYADVGGNVGKSRPQCASVATEVVYDIIADMMLLAQAGIWEMENFSETTELCRWKMSEEFGELVKQANQESSNRDTEGLAVRLINTCGKDRPGSLKAIDNYVMSHYG